MLQIITEKFFDDKKIISEEKFDILYSNFNWISNIDLGHCELSPIDYSNKSINGYEGLS